MSARENRNGGIGLLGAVFIVFLVLKLTHNITWSWWWVTSPLWMPAAAAIAIVGVIFIVAFPAGIIADIIATRRRNKRLDAMYRAGRKL